MARQTGANIFAGTLEPLAGGPLDARAIVPTKADLTLSSNFPYPYIGMIVAVQAEGKAYILTAADFTDVENWTEIGSGGGANNIIEGYFNPIDNLFYEEDTYTTPISGESNIIYVTLDTNKSYRYDGLNLIFVRLDKDFENPQQSSLPTASVDELGNIYQYVGATTVDYTNGYFYICVEDSDNPGTYIWEQKNVQPDLDTVIQYTTMPAAALALSGNVVQFIGATTADYIHGFFYECEEDVDNPGTYIWTQVDTQPDEDTTIQVEVIPTAAASIEGKVVQFIGTTTVDYTNGYFYECIEDPDVAGTYIWVQKNTQPDADTKIQVESMPTATSTIEGEIVQYIGTTTADYINAYFYKCVEDSENPGTYKWDAVSVQAGGSGSGSLQKAITASIDVGGIKTGDAFAIGTDYDDMWQNLLDPIKYPTLTAPSASIAGGTTLLETGSSVSRTITVTFNRGSINPAYGTSGYRSGAAADYSLNNGTAQAENTFIETISESNKTFKAKVNYAAGEQPKDSKGNNYDNPLPAGYVETSTLTYKFDNPIWANTSSISTVAKLSLLDHTSTKQKDMNFPAQTVANPEIFDIPASWTVTAVQVKNDLSGQYEDCSSEFTVTNTTHNDAGGTSVAYKRYTDNRGYNAGARTIRVKWS